MKLVIERDHALKALSHIQSIAKGRGTIPILANVKLEAADGGVVLTVNNQDLQASTTASAQVETPGETTVEARRLFDIVKAFPSGGQVAMEMQSDGRMAVRCARVRYVLATLPASDFPVFPPLDEGMGGMIGREVLARLLTRTRFACSQLDTQYLMTGIWLHTNDEQSPARLIAVGTDKVSMGIAQAPAPDGFSITPGVLIPASAADEFIRLLAGADDYVELRFSQTLFELRIGTTEITGKLLDLQGTDWLNWRRAMEQGGSLPATVDLDLMQDSINRALLVSNDDLRTVDMTFSDGVLSLRAKAQGDLSNLSEELDIDYAGAERAIRVNAKKVREVLGQITGENAVLYVPDTPLSAVLITDSKDKWVRYLVVQHRGS